jgi:hypothetical protein
MKIVAQIGAVLLGIIAAVVEVLLLIHDPWQILNPFFQLTVLWYYIQLPLVWLITAITLFSVLIAHK